MTRLDDFMYMWCRAACCARQARREAELEEKCGSLWTFLESHRSSFVSHLYNLVRIGGFRACSDSDCCDNDSGTVLADWNKKAFDVPVFLDTKANKNMNYWCTPAFPYARAHN